MAYILGVCFGRMLWAYALGVCCGRMLWAYALGVCFGRAYALGVCFGRMALVASLWAHRLGHIVLGVCLWAYEFFPGS